MTTLTEICTTALHNKLIQLVIIAVIIDTFFGVLRAIKYHKFNSGFGIDGAIRKCAMIISIMMLALVDYITGFNMIGFLPEEIRQYIGESIGISGFFALLYIAYEIVSILKNMALCGLPVKKLWLYVKTFLNKYTDELPDDDELAADKVAPEISSDKTYINK
jgi:toxin secretion/phage lysis holin